MPERPNRGKRVPSERFHVLRDPLLWVAVGFLVAFAVIDWVLLSWGVR
jgi:hypothetical protein